jgi:glycosyltransferase 2 family protein
VLLAGKLAVSVGLLVVLFRQTDVASVAAYLDRLAPAWIAGALGIYGAMIVISAWRWRVLLRAQGLDAPLRRLGSSFLIATFFNNFLPSNIGGDVIRVADTAPIAGSRTVAAGIVLVDRALGLIALMLIAGIGSMTSQVARFGGPETAWIWAALAGVMLAAVPTLLAPQLLPVALAPIRWIGGAWAEARIGRLTGMLRRLQDRPGSIAIAFGGAIAVQVVLVAFYLSVARGLGIPLTALGALLVVPISLAVQMVPVSINGFGVREAVFTYYFARLGLGVDAALALSLLSTVTIALFSLSGGIVFALRRGGLMTAAFTADTPH